LLAHHTIQHAFITYSQHKVALFKCAKSSIYCCIACALQPFVGNYQFYSAPTKNCLQLVFGNQGRSCFASATPKLWITLCIGLKKELVADGIWSSAHSSSSSISSAFLHL
jgi:hypothetical protein